MCYEADSVIHDSAPLRDESLESPMGAIAARSYSESEDDSLIQ